MYVGKGGMTCKGDFQEFVYYFGDIACMLKTHLENFTYFIPPGRSRIVPEISVYLQWTYRSLKFSEQRGHQISQSVYF